MPHVGFADVGHKKERKGIMLFGKFQIYMPNAGFVGVRHREYTKVCDSAFLFRASSRAAGRYTGSGGMKSGLVCMFYAGFAGVEHRKRMALHWVRYWLVLAALHTLLCPTSALPTSGIKGEKRPKRLNGGQLC